MRPTDPLYADQWHFGLIGNIEAIWRDYRGAGVIIGVNDDSPDRRHPDLNRNFDPSLGYSGVNRPFGDAHGTSVAGIIGAEANGLGGVGVAPNATLGWVSYFYEGSYASLARTVDFDVVNNSWGFVPSFVRNEDLSDPNSAGSEMNASLRLAAETGRNGLGTISVHAAGNDNANSIGEWFSGTRYTISVAATESDGFAASYSSYGSSVLLTAPAAAVTTDSRGNAGYSPGNFTNAFGGTSASAPVVTGVVALMLDAAPELGWRDVKTILALSASLTGSAPDATAPAATEDGLWQTLDNRIWNGGGQLYHVNYGYGMVNVYAAVRMAEAWLAMTRGPATSATETIVSSGPALGSPVAIAPPVQGFPQVTQISIHVSQIILIETAYLSLQWTHGQPSDLSIRLISPNGHSVMLLDRDGFGDPTPGMTHSWTFGIEALRNMSSQGTWRLEVIDHLLLNRGSLDGVELIFHGQQANPDTIYSFTEDFLILAALDSARRLVTDTDGGIDWLNLAAIAGDIQASLRSGGRVAVDELDWFHFGSGPAHFENLHAGDGHDRLVGNGMNNNLIGGRGHDRIFGLQGADLLEGGRGLDVLFGGAGDDSLNGGAHRDHLFGGDGGDRLDGGRGNDILTGGAGADQFVFAAGFGSDRIADFRTGSDVLLFSAALTGGLTAAQDIIARFARIMGDGLLFDFGHNQQLLLADVTELTNPAADILIYDLA